MVMITRLWNNPSAKYLLLNNAKLEKKCIQIHLTEPFQMEGWRNLMVINLSVTICFMAISSNFHQPPFDKIEK